MAYPLSAQEVVLRRFSPKNPHMWVDDHPTSPPRLKSGAIKFDDDGCSVFRDMMLESTGQPRAVLTPTEQHAVAGAKVDEIERVEAGSSHLQVVSAAWPDGWSAEHPEDAAHALVQLPEPLPRKKVDLVASRLARVLKPLPLKRDRAV